MKKKHEIRGKNVQLKVAISKEQTRLKLLDEKLRKLFIMNIDRAMKKSKEILLIHKVNFKSILSSMEQLIK